MEDILLALEAHNFSIGEINDTVALHNEMFDMALQRFRQLDAELQKLRARVEELEAQCL